MNDHTRYSLALDKRKSYFAAYRVTNKITISVSTSAADSARLPDLLKISSPFKLILEINGFLSVRKGQNLICSLDNFGRIIRILNAYDSHFNFQYDHDSRISSGESILAKDNTTYMHYRFLAPNEVFTNNILNLSNCNPSATLYRAAHKNVSYFIGAIKADSPNRYESLYGFDLFDEPIYSWSYNAFPDMHLYDDLIGNYGAVLGYFIYEYDDQGRLLSAVNPMNRLRGGNLDVMEVVGALLPNEYTYKYDDNGNLEIIGFNYDFPSSKSKKSITFHAKDSPNYIIGQEENKEIIEEANYDDYGRVTDITVSCYKVPRVLKFMSKKLQYQNIFKFNYE